MFVRLQECVSGLQVDMFFFSLIFHRFSLIFQQFRGAELCFRQDGEWRLSSVVSVQEELLLGVYCGKICFEFEIDWL